MISLGEYEKFHLAVVGNPRTNRLSGLSRPEVVEDCALLAEFYLAVIGNRAPGQARCSSVGGHGWRISPRHLAEVFRPPHRILPALWAAAVSWPGDPVTLVVRDLQAAGAVAGMIQGWHRASELFGQSRAGDSTAPWETPAVVSGDQFAKAADSGGTVVIDDVMDVWTAALAEGNSGILWNRLERCARILGTSVSARTFISAGEFAGNTPVGLPDFLDGVFSTVSAFSGNPFGGADFLLYDAGEVSSRRERQDSILVMATEALLAGAGDALILAGSSSEARELAGTLEGPAMAHGRSVWCGGEDPVAGESGVLFIAPAPARLPSRVSTPISGVASGARAPEVTEIVLTSMPDATDLGLQMPHGISGHVFAELAIRRSIASCTQHGSARVMVPSWLAETGGPVIGNIVGWFGEAGKKTG